MKKYLISFGYTYLVVNSKEQALDLLTIQPVKREYVDNQYIYIPEDTEIEVKLIDESDIRELTKKWWLYSGRSPRVAYH